MNEHYDIVSRKFSVNCSGAVIEYTDPKELPGAKTPGARSYPDANLSKINRQKRSIANACAYLGQNAQAKPLLFVLTCPIASDTAMINQNVSKFFNNIQKDHAWGRCYHYVWCREYQKNGRPHWHVIADIEKFDIRKVNDYWSSLWGSDSKNSLRMHPKKSRFLQQNNQALTWYLTKYFTKTMAIEQKTNRKGAAPRKFSISNKLRELSKPVTLQGGFDDEKISLALTGKKIKFSSNGVHFWY